MARRPRREVGDGIFHVSCRGNRRQTIATCERDASWFFAILGEATERHELACLGYCLMSNHYHLLVRGAGEALSAGMRRLNGSYAQWFNRFYGVSGHLFQGRFHAVRVDRDPHLVEVMRYVVLNPVRAGLASRPEEWPWSSYAATIGAAPAPPFLAVRELLLHFAPDVRLAQQRFAALVHDALSS